ncbi:hypothetical protein PHMEG_00021018 [Phytophthora megakarya]|uniref:Uncharacterized protein n=1 Tax=Phytophthora megakarya TaxID=4795 RepID=A0A225VNW2_9STRA|nr:hypothetical protein PHMEG_00021018 [Phytophthora megakarya]
MASFEPGASTQIAPVPSEPTTDAASRRPISVPQRLDSAATSGLSALKAEPIIQSRHGTKYEERSTTVEACYITSTSFPEGAKKAKGDYNPPTGSPASRKPNVQCLWHPNR